MVCPPLKFFDHFFFNTRQQDCSASLFFCGTLKGAIEWPRGVLLAAKTPAVQHVCKCSCLKPTT